MSRFRLHLTGNEKISMANKVYGVKPGGGRTPCLVIVWLDQTIHKSTAVKILAGNIVVDPLVKPEDDNGPWDSTVGMDKAPEL